MSRLVMNTLLALYREFLNYSSVSLAYFQRLRPAVGQKLVLGRLDITTALEVAVAAWFYSASESQSNFGKFCIQYKNIGPPHLQIAASWV